VEGRPVQQVRGLSRTKAILHDLQLDSAFRVTVQALGEDGHTSSPGVLLYQPSLLAAVEERSRRQPPPVPAIKTDNV